MKHEFLIQEKLFHETCALANLSAHSLCSERMVII